MHLASAERCYNETFFILPMNPEKIPLPAKFHRSVFPSRKAEHIIVLMKGTERYEFHCDRESTPDMMRQFGIFAGDPELSFGWYDAAVLCQNLRKQTKSLLEGR